MNLFDRIWTELVEESTYVASRLQRWWYSMSEGEQLMLLGIVCAAGLLIGLRRPAHASKFRAYETHPTMGVAKQFLFAGVVLVIFTFGADIALESLA